MNMGEKPGLSSSSILTVMYIALKSGCMLPRHNIVDGALKVS